CMGNGEWYVGTRGGFGDHGAMLFGKHGHILHSVFLTVDEMRPEYIPFPQEYQVVIINSYKSSTKSSERLFAYNQTMFAYSIAMILIKDILQNMEEYNKEFLDKITYLGQIVPKAFGLKNIYEILKLLPERITISDLKARYSPAEIDKRLDRYFGQIGKYPEFVEVRGAALWGIAESERSREFAKLIKDGKISSAGELMNIGHDGDRLYTLTENGIHIKFAGNKVTDDYLNKLIDDIQSKDSKRIQGAQLARQPGDFDASSVELDSIVDIACSADGVIGASLTGAGFGGNILAINERNEESLAKLKNALLKEYYEPHELEELEWIQTDGELRTLLKDDDIEGIKRRLKNIVEKKQKARSGMDFADIKYAESVQRKTNKLFREGKIDRELSFIPADYYTDGVVVNTPVEMAEVL
ncbi:hypothetical protein M1146_03295, partial [Patescibacteria group bacterium]|nr:hypothetical protein [Patescibacteria group bacterium]